MANKNLQGTIEYYIKGQYGLIKGEDGKEYCFGRKAVTARAKLFNGDVVRFTVDQKHHILASKVTSYVAVRSKIRKALANKGYSFQSEKGGKWSIIVKNGDRKMVLEEYGHMTLPEATEWAQRAKKLTKEDIDKMFEKNDMKSNVNTEKSNMKNDDCKIGGHVVPDNMAKNFDEILTSMLEQLENNPNQDIDVLVKDECEKMGVSEEGKALLSETNEYIDGFAEKMAALQTAKEDGKSRKQWMLEEMDRILKGRDEQEKAEIVSAISDAGENVNNETLTNEED